MGKRRGWLLRDDALRHGVVEHGSDRAEAVSGFEVAPLLPAEDRGSIDEQHLLHVRVLCGGVEELLERAGEQLERVVARVDDGGGGEVGLHLVEDGAEQVLLVREVVVERAASADLRLGDDLFGARGEVAVGDEELTGGGNERGSSGVAPSGAVRGAP